MNWGAWLGLTIVFAALMLVVQRTEARRRRVTALVMLVAAELVRRYLMYRGWPVEGFWAFGAALILNVLFWLLIGRKRPPHSSDEIQVIGNE